MSKMSDQYERETGKSHDIIGPGEPWRRYSPAYVEWLERKAEVSVELAVALRKLLDVYEGPVEQFENVFKALAKLDGKAKGKEET